MFYTGTPFSHLETVDIHSRNLDITEGCQAPFENIESMHVYEQEEMKEFLSPVCAASFNKFELLVPPNQHKYRKQ